LAAAHEHLTDALDLRDLRDMIMMGESEGLTFRNVGRVGRLGGSSPPAAAIAA
jgi:hypothetical protein